MARPLDPRETPLAIKFFAESRGQTQVHLKERGKVNPTKLESLNKKEAGWEHNLMVSIMDPTFLYHWMMVSTVLLVTIERDVI